MVERACRAIEAHTEGTLSLAALGTEVGVSPYHLQRTFKSVTGVTPRQYAAAHRVNQFKARVRGGETVTGAMYEAGYGSSSRLYEKAAPELLGMTPAVYRRGGAGMSITYTIVGCALGRLLVAATERGCAPVSVGESDEGLEASFLEVSLRRIRRDETAALGEWTGAILRHPKGNKLARLTFRCAGHRVQHASGTARRIPYAACAHTARWPRAVGQPSAVRAVARPGAQPGRARHPLQSSDPRRRRPRRLPLGRRTKERLLARGGRPRCCDSPPRETANGDSDSPDGEQLL